jgi:nucleotide-binding universal stress UspA family protein
MFFVLPWRSKVGINWNTGIMECWNTGHPLFHSSSIPIIFFCGRWGMYKKILVPLDGSELAITALDEAEKLAKTFDAEIILFQVVPFMPIYGSPELVTPLIVDEKQKEATEKYLANLGEELKKKGLKVAAMARTGQQVAIEIIDFAKEAGVDLIIMCTHGRSGISRWVMGSVALKVLTRAETPILLIRSKK